MKSLFLMLCALMLCQPVQAADTAPDSAQVLLFGTFHFKDAGLDLVKQKDVDVMAEDAQAYLEQLSERLVAFGPTRVLLEYLPEQDETINRQYRDYLAGTFELPANEIYQLGFRIAKAAGNDRVYGFDNRDLEWEAEAMFEYGKAHASPELEAMDATIQQMTRENAEARESLPLRELLRRSNDPVLDRRNMDLYLATNAIGAGDGYAGAVAASSWWARNLRMYANIQQLATPGQRVIAIGGQGHVAILRQLLTIDRRLQAVAIDDYL